MAPVGSAVGVNVMVPVSVTVGVSVGTSVALAVHVGVGQTNLMEAPTQRRKPAKFLTLGLVPQADNDCEPTNILWPPLRIQKGHLH
jgi:hypothetical protein